MADISVSAPKKPYRLISNWKFMHFYTQPACIPNFKQLVMVVSTPPGDLMGNDPMTCTQP